jgi:hypothetical protein
MNDNINKVAACIKDNLVVNVAVFNENTSNSWLEQIKSQYDKVIITEKAGIGYTYDEERDAFIPPKPYSKWILNEDTCQWEAPIPYPTDDKRYVWNDNKGEWEEVVE